MINKILITTPSIQSNSSNKIFLGDWCKEDFIKNPKNKNYHFYHWNELKKKEKDYKY